jgi:hypothetical protein
MEPRVGNKFRLGRKIGSGSFGEIYLGEQPRLVLGGVFFFGCVRAFFSLMSDDEIVLCVPLVDAGTNIQTNEEVAIKLVRALSLLD